MVEAYSSPTTVRQLPNEVLLGEVARMLAEGRDVVVVSKGRSMLPFIRGGIDRVMLRKLERVKVGDIVLAFVDGRFVLHRVVAISADELVLMGDGNINGVEHALLENVAGTVVEIITPQNRHRKPADGWLWRKALPVRKYLLKIYRKWNKLRASSRVPKSRVNNRK